MSAQKLVAWFHEVDKHDVGIVGGKGANLGEMSQAGFPVPPGFIVTAASYFQFIEKAKLAPKINAYLARLDYDNPKALEQTAKVIQHAINHAPIPTDIAETIIEHYFKLAFYEELVADHKATLVNRVKKFFISHTTPVAIRSSATAEDLPEASFAGQQATYLNIKGEANVIDTVRKAWASLFTARAIFYRHNQGYDHVKVGLAAVVQKMVSSSSSGVMFTIDPVTNTKDTVVIEAIFGLGELIVQGAVTPDHFEVNKHTMTMVKKSIHEQKEYMPGVGKRSIPLPHQLRKKQKVTDQEVLEIAKIGKKLEHHYYFPQDVEWAIEKDRVYIVQTRPITTTHNKRLDENGDFAGQLAKMEILLTGDPASPGTSSGKVCIIRSLHELSKIQKGDVLVAEQTNPDFVPAMRKAVAIVTERGGRTSHAAIVSRELGLPAVVGTEGALKKLHDGMEITVDGKSGTIYRGGIAGGGESSRHMPIDEVSMHLKTATKVYVNLAEERRADEVAKLNVDGVGLLRAEFMLAEIGTHPKYFVHQKKQKVFIAELSTKIAHFCKAFGMGRPVIYRTTDFKTNEYRDLKKGELYEKTESNPMLGFRGAFRYIKDSETFEMELEAIRQVRQKMGWKNLHVMLPFVRTPDELAQAKKIMASVGLIRTPTFKLLMMVELPVNIICLDDFIKVGIDGISIGSNDLTQLIMGLDRDNADVASEFDERNPAVLWALERAITIAHKHHITSSICGQAPSDYPELVAKLVQWGITSVSVNADAVASVRKTIWENERKHIK